MSDEEIYKNINQLKSRWRFRTDGEAKSKALVIIKAIEKNGTQKGSNRGLKQIQFNKAYDGAVGKLINMANNAPDRLFQKVYRLVVRYSDILFNERDLLNDVFIEPRRYREIQRGNFISKIDVENFPDALYYGCKVSILYEIKQIKQKYSNFKGRSSVEFLRIVATSKELELTPQQAKAYLFALTGEKYRVDRITKLYKKLT